MVFILFFSLGIGKYVTQPIVRGFLGDFLVVFKDISYRNKQKTVKIIKELQEN